MAPSEHESPKPLEPPGTSSSESRSAAIRTWTSDQLFGEANEARIIHRGETYRLLRTRSRKLILVK